MGNGSSHSIRDDESVTRKTTEKGGSTDLKIQYAVSGMKGIRHTMEDRHIACLEIPVALNEPLKDHCLFAVLDGHGGSFASTYIEEHFLEVLSGQPDLLKYCKLPKTGLKSRSDVNGIQLFKKAIEKAFLELDQQLIQAQKKRSDEIAKGRLTPPFVEDSETEDEDERARPKKRRNQEIPNMVTSLPAERSGSTAVMVVITPTHIICANTGDSRAVLRRYSKTLPLSFDHKPTEVPERHRICAAGGVVKGKRVDGDLAVSRAFGDFLFKDDPGLSPEHQRIIVKPDFVVLPRDNAGDEFIIVACDGVWDVASNTQCSEFVQLLLSEGEVDLSHVCEEAIDTCLDRNSKDNITMMIVGFPAMKVDTSSTATISNALWGHRATRRVRRLTAATTYVTHSTCRMIGREYIGIEQGMCA